MLKCCMNVDVSRGQGLFPWEVSVPCPQMLCDSSQPSWVVSAFEGPPQAADGAVVDSLAVVEDGRESVVIYCVP